MNEDKKLELIEKINDALQELRPHLIADGGNVSIHDVTDEMEVLIKWEGNCEMCTMSAMTLKAGVEQAILNRVDEIKSVRAMNGVGLV